mmetsp:Transcript_1026/g.3194  ORF Transcript_1026/g.3194 Transcript_1026/m.3194 type:complete len:519 (+) Transcript_1026:61-1617(+)
MASLRGDGDEGRDYLAKVGHLNVLPSRQNVLWNGGYLEGCLPSPGSLMPRGPLSLDTPQHMERQLASPQRMPSWGHVSANGDAQLPLLGPGAPLDKARSDDGTGDLDERDTLSTPEAVFNLANTVLGVGVLSVPYAFRLSGYSTLLLVLLTIAVTSRTAGFIGEALVLAARSPGAAAVPRKGRDFIFLAHVAFGPRGRAVIGAITSLEIWFALVTFMVMNGVNASLIWPGLGCSPAIIASCVLAALTVFVPMRFFSYLSLVSSLSLAAAAVSMVGAALTMPSWANPYDHLGIPALLQLQNMPRSVGIIVFCFAGHPCFPVVHECMRDRGAWNSSVGITFLLAAAYYGGLGVFGYLVFGQDLAASFTMNLAQLQGTVLFRLASAVAFLVKIQLTAPLLMNAIIVSFWAPAVGAPEWPPGRVLALAMLTVATGLTASAFSNDVAAVASLTGSLFTMTTSVIFPALVHLRLVELFGARERRLRAELPHLLVLAFGFVMAIAGTALTVRDLVGARTRAGNAG